MRALQADVNSLRSEFRTEINNLRSDVNSRFTAPTWAVSINAAAPVAILGALLHGIR